VATEEDSGGLEAARPAQLKGHMHFSSEPRRDGYRPIVEPLWAWAQTVGIPQRQQSLLVLSAARRLDTGHLQVERVRDGIDSLLSLSSPAGREQLYEVLGDAEIALIALNRAITMAAKLNGLYRLPVSYPKIVSEKRSLLDNLRDAYEHVDDRALDRIHGKAAGEEAMLGFRSFSVLIEERRFTDGNDTPWLARGDDAPRDRNARLPREVMGGTGRASKSGYSRRVVRGLHEREAACSATCVTPTSTWTSGR
jgi:hypothetical protein